VTYDKACHQKHKSTMSILFRSVGSIFWQGRLRRWSGLRWSVGAIWLGGGFLGDRIYTLSPGFLGARASVTGLVIAIHQFR
jgi:hypothetical protein